MSLSSPFAHVLPVLADALTQRGFQTLTPVQVAVSTPKFKEEDLLVSAQTGSGKTVAFGLAMAATLLNEGEALSAPSAPLAVVIAPTRELAMQVRGELTWLFASARGRIAGCVGGMDIRAERRALDDGAHIVVGTPGRLADHIRRGSLQMGALQVVVLDEADEMLNLGFREELEFILEAAPEERRTLMFSATLPSAIEALAKKYQRHAQRVSTISTQQQHADIDYHVVMAPAPEAENAIFNVLRFHEPGSAIVFCATRAAVTRLASRLGNRGLSVVALSGELSQTERTRALQAMRDHRAQVCVATDVAARGIDLPSLDLVIHADLPRDTEGLLHRSGRTGRAGRKGASVLIAPYSARRRTERLLQSAGISAHWSDPPTAESIMQKDDARLLAEPVLHEPASAAETEIVNQLLAQFDPAQLAAAFVRLARRGQAPAEDIVPPTDWRGPNSKSERPAKRERADAAGGFAGGAWISLSVGRKQSAEPRWLIPMLCKAGGLSKRDIGAIHVQHRETFVEINAESLADFFERVGPTGRLEKTIAVKQVEGPTAAIQDGDEARAAHHPRAARKPRGAVKEKDAGKNRKAPKKKKSSWRPDV